MSKAAKMLQDSGLRGALDAHLEDTELRRMALKEAEKLERERQWRVAKGLEAPGWYGSSIGEDIWIGGSRSYK